MGAVTRLQSAKAKMPKVCELRCDASSALDDMICTMDSFHPGPGSSSE